MTSPGDGARAIPRLRAALTHPVVQRVASLGVAVVASVPLGLAARLAPDPTGNNTHTQLGLAPCTILQATGYPCPMCGATTSWALMADLRVGAAFLNQPFAALLFLVALAAVGVGLAEAIQPRGRWARLGGVVDRYDAVVGGTILILMFLGWTWKLARMQGWV